MDCIQTQEHPSQDVPAGTTTYPAHSSTSEPVPTLEIKDFFPSIKSEDLASQEYHQAFHSPRTSTGWGSAHTEKLEQRWRWNEGMQSRSRAARYRESPRVPTEPPCPHHTAHIMQIERRRGTQALTLITAHNEESLHQVHRFIPALDGEGESSLPSKGCGTGVKLQVKMALDALASEQCSPFTSSSQPLALVIPSN